MKYLTLAAIAALSACAAPGAQSLAPTPAAPAVSSDNALPQSKPGCHLFFRGIKRGQLINHGVVIHAPQQKGYRFEGIRLQNGFLTATVTVDPLNDTDGSEMLTVGPQSTKVEYPISAGRGVIVAVRPGSPNTKGPGVIFTARSCRQ